MMGPQDHWAGWLCEYFPRKNDSRARRCQPAVKWDLPGKIPTRFHPLQVLHCFWPSRAFRVQCLRPLANRADSLHRSLVHVLPSYFARLTSICLFFHPSIYVSSFLLLFSTCTVFINLTNYLSINISMYCFYLSNLCIYTSI